MKPWTPRPYQPLMIDHILRNPRCALFVPMGMGKSSAVLAALDILLLAGLSSKILILGPLRVIKTTWPDEIRKWSTFSHLRVSVITGSSVERRAALRVDADIYCMNYENLEWLIAETTGALVWVFDTVISDEMSRTKSFRLRQGGKRMQALAKVAHTKVKRYVGLTGTPAPNGLQDLWGAMWFLDQGKRLGRSFSAFENRWFGFQRAKDALNAHKTFVKRIAFPHAQSEIQALLKDVCLALDPKDWFDLDEPIVNKVYVDLPPVARKHYKEIENHMFTELQGHDIEVFGAAAKTMKALQFANGSVIVDESKWVEVHDVKIDALESIIEEASGMPVLVAYHFKADLVRLLKRFPQGRALDSDPQTVIDWNEGRIPVLFAHPMSAGHGLSLQDGGNIIVFFAFWWALEDHLQVIERIGPMRQKQSGYERPVFIHHIVARDTIDEVVLERHRTKREVQDLLMDYMAEKKNASAQPDPDRSH